MKISYVLQLKDFMIMILIGLIIGAVYGILNIATNIKKNIILQIISDFVFCTITTFTFIVAINYINMGEIRLFLCVGYVIGITLERITIGKLFAKGFKWVYNGLKILGKKFKESRLGRMILK